MCFQLVWVIYFIIGRMNNFKFFQKRNPYKNTIQWRTGQGSWIPINILTNSHIRNILSCLRGEGDRIIPNPYQGVTHDEWYDILVNEFGNRINE